jgi:hypothetical protein
MAPLLLHNNRKRIHRKRTPVPPVRVVPPSPDSTPPVRVVRDVPPVPQQLPKKRIMKQRHPFDIYQDQYDSLKEISLAERKLGLLGSQSALAREGLDLIIEKKKKELNLE